MAHTEQPGKLSNGQRAEDEMRQARQHYAIIWDVDGVIIDSAEQHRRAWEQLAHEQGFSFSDEAFRRGFGMRNTDVIPMLFGVREPERLTALANHKEALYRELLSREAVALPGAKELMTALHEAGYQQALGSSAPPENIRVIVALLGLGDLLQAIVSGEEVAHGKPAPDIFLTAARKLSIEPSCCLVIEDAPAGVAAAHAGGMRCLAVRRAGQSDVPGLEAAEQITDTLRVVDVAQVDHLLSVS